jgi:hypothetical protein
VVQVNVLLDKDTEVTVPALKDADVHVCRDDNKPMQTVQWVSQINGFPLHAQQSMLSGDEWTCVLHNPSAKSTSVDKDPAKSRRWGRRSMGRRKGSG